ncbi:MAG TPA: hypothetical protein DCF45_06755, partial [Gammaproteobacteria bacterium]|nr:hypothetical protein [Gammaproteobacteria bacterium]
KRLELVETLFDGKEPRLFSNSRTPLVDENGEVYALVFIGFDVTETAEQEQRANNRVRMEALGKLTGGVAHDYNNMLAIILGYAELLLQSATENSETAQYADEILRAGNRGASLTKKLLAFARQQPGNTEQADINDVLRNNQEMLEKTLTSQIELELKLAPEPMLVEVDLAELEDAIINLAINAMQAMPEGGRLTITTGQRRASAKLIQKSFLQAGEYVLLTVSDDGIGMKEEILSRIFEPFFTTKGEQGTGLGLSQVYGFVRRSGGDIQVTSTPGKGSRFELYFPISKNLQRPQESEIRPSLIGAKKQPEESPHRHHILVVDDEPALVALTEELLSSHGYRVTA